MPIYFYYIALSLSLLVSGVYLESAWSLLCFWISTALAIVSLAYIAEKPSIFRKKADGRIPLPVNILLLPFIAGVHAYNIIAKWSDKRKNIQYIHQIEAGLCVATRLNGRDFLSLENFYVSAIVDMTAEFSALDWSASVLELNYLNVPVLDHQSPKAEELRQAITWIDNHITAQQRVVVHCALGRGRSVFVVAAYLLAKSPELSVREVLENISRIRASAGLNKAQMKRLVKYHRQQQIYINPAAHLIANPASGGGKWPEYKDEVLLQLFKHFKLTIKETTPQVSAEKLTREALTAGAETIIAAGGDGTLREVAQQLVNTDKRFGLLPMGTANALAHNLYGNVSKIIPIETALEHLLSGQVKAIDTALCNDKTVLLLVGIGLEHEMIDYADRQSKDEAGQFAYLEGFWKAYMAGKEHALNVAFNDEQANPLKTTSLVIANAAPFTSILAQGNGAPDFRDGYLDVTWINADKDNSNKFIDLAELITAGLNLRSQNSQENNNIHTRLAETITIESQQPIEYVIDGELFSDERLEIKSNHKSLQVMMKAAGD
ncbi:diacylglycerol kinase family protein [Thalassomonas haliotis]|uniref:Dual specificity protein phosphatase family protein n=1 Tax=Thalassomonas haliotis TaxID=485448 RepID=A0ABY7VIL9_9GAMM|nr:diacylglycerol kinase family protein [Thalassomonas haliotis]WDE12522.1 dual specificity protein phosphatase family protein [Thalassomonas haliotis]